MARLFLYCICFAAMLLASWIPASAQDKDMVVITPGAATNCTAAHARNISFQNLALHLNQYKGRCVRVTGVTDGRALFKDLDGLYVVDDAITFRSGDYPEGRIGIYWPLEKNPPDLPKDGQMAPSHVKPPAGVVQIEIVGVPGLCDSLRGLNVFMVTGYCHSNFGPYFAASRFIVRSAPLKRLTSQDDRWHVGSLAFAPDAWGDLLVVKDVAQQWLRAIQQSDIETYARITGFVGEPNPNNVGSFEYKIFKDPESSFAKFRGTTSIPQMAMFVKKRPGSASADPIQFDQDGVFSCFCRVDDCSDRWPISTVDAANSPQRPYICTVISRGDTGGSPRWTASTDFWANDLLEP